MASKIGDLYELLGVSKSASDEELKRAYKKMAIKHHPDRNPNNKEEANTMFQKINKAYHVLSTPEGRSKYDKFGIVEGENDSGMGGGGGMPPGMNPFDMFSNLFGGMGMPGMGMPGMQQQQQGMDPTQARRNAKSPDKKLTINLSLKDLYNGRMIPIDFQRIVKCDKCDGLGAANKEHIKSCGVCGGKGRIVRMQQMGPMIHQTVQPCYQCSGGGKSIEKGCECIQCGGKKTVMQNRHVDCYVRPGAAIGSHISFKNESDWVPDFGDSGDLLVYIDAKNDDFGMKREGDNLVMRRSVSLLEALTQTIIYFRHFDDRVIKVLYEDIIRPGATMIIDGEGMPKFNDSISKGNLIIHFEVVFPTHIEKERAKYLTKILPTAKKQIWDIALESTPENDITIKTMKEHIISSENTAQGSQSKFYDDDDELREEAWRNVAAGGGGGDAGPQIGECATQ